MWVPRAVKGTAFASNTVIQWWQVQPDEPEGILSRSPRVSTCGWNVCSAAPPVFGRGDGSRIGDEFDIALENQTLVVRPRGEAEQILAIDAILDDLCTNAKLSITLWLKALNENQARSSLSKRLFCTYTEELSFVSAVPSVCVMKVD